MNKQIYSKLTKAELAEIFPPITRNNASFATPPDGTPGRLQMLLFVASPERDSGFDSGIVIHEYGHGVSTRLSGGPTDSNGLNAFQSRGLGEGWSDWYGLMLTMQPGDANTTLRDVGTYLFGGAPQSGGIRDRYRGNSAGVLHGADSQHRPG